MAICHYHPDRAGVGICMRCRVVICADCSTRVDGVNHCHACLRALGTHQEARRKDLSGPLLGMLLFGFSVGLLFLLSLFAQGWLAP